MKYLTTLVEPVGAFAVAAERGFEGTAPKGAREKEAAAAAAAGKAIAIWPPRPSVIRGSWESSTVKRW